MAYKKKAPAMLSKAEMLDRIVEPIREAMAQGKLLWLRPWAQGSGGGLPYNPLRPGEVKDYTGGVNVLLLMISAMSHGWSDPRWMGRGQIRKRNFSIAGLSNAKSTLIYIPVFGYRTIRENGEEKTIRYVMGFREGMVYNAEQIDDETFPALSMPDKAVDTVTGYERAHAIYKAVGVPVTHGAHSASYIPSEDRIMMPEESAFTSMDGYHATRLHETGHATGHSDRMDRNLFGGFGSPSYAEEELTAEFFSAFACADAGIEKTELTENHSAYLQSWHRRLGEDPEVLIRAVNGAWNALTFVRERIE